jgi:hypothetical protein
VQVKVDPDQKAAQRFHTALRELQRISGKDFETVMKAELGAMLTSAVRNTKKATNKSIETNHRRQPGARYSIEYAGPTSRTGAKYTSGQIAALKRRAAERRSKAQNGKLVYYLRGSNQSHRHPGWLLGKIRTFRDKSLENKKKARGLAASMFYKIGEALKIPVDAPGYVRKAAHHKKGDMRELIQVMSKGSGNSYEVGFVNSLTHINNWAKAGLAFRQALNARANFFSRALKLEAQGKIKKTLDRYPGLASQS